MIAQFARESRIDRPKTFAPKRRKGIITSGLRNESRRGGTFSVVHSNGSDDLGYPRLWGSERGITKLTTMPDDTNRRVGVRFDQE